MRAVFARMAGEEAKEADRGSAAAHGPSGDECSPVQVAVACAGASSSTACAADQGSSSLSKHALHHSWCLWALKSDGSSTKDNWHGSQMKVGEFDTVEDFWRHFNNIRRPSKLGTIDFSMFKKDIAPAWEDETCKHGGRWIAKLESKTPAEDFDKLWMELILTMIGEAFNGDGGELVCGAVASARAKGNSKVALWVSEKDQEKVMPIGRAFANVLLEATGYTGNIHFEDFSQSGKAMFSFRDE